jgi:hypothetical protein
MEIFHLNKEDLYAQKRRNHPRYPAIGHRESDDPSNEEELYGSDNKSSCHAYRFGDVTRQLNFALEP